MAKRGRPPIREKGSGSIYFCYTLGYATPPPHHIVQRGHNCAACFFADEDYQTYHHWLGSGVVSRPANRLNSPHNK